MPPKVVRRTLDLAGVQVPFVEITGSAGGPELTVIAGVHGCEYASIAGVRSWARALESAGGLRRGGKENPDAQDQRRDARRAS